MYTLINSFCLNFPENCQMIDACKISGIHSDLKTMLFTPLDESKLNVSLTGSIDSVDNARRDILSNKVLRSSVTISSFNQHVLLNTEIKTRFYQRLIDIARNCNVKINIHSTSTPEIHIVGSIDAIEVARVEILVLLDKMSDLYTDKLEMSNHIHNLIGGRKHVQLQSIMEETYTSIYLESPFSTICGMEPLNTIYLSGESPSEVKRAKELLIKLANKKVESMYHKTFTMDPKKINWILLNYREDIRKIMRDNGSFFLFPSLGSGSNSVSIYAENRIYGERSTRLLNYLTHNIFQASISLKPNSSENVKTSGDSNIFESTEQSLQIMKQVSQSSKADISYNTKLNTIELFGTEKQVKEAYKLLSNMPVIMNNLNSIAFILELATEQREFISGKKNGKINKITKSNEVSIRFETSNKYNSYIILESNTSNEALEGLALLQDEMPAEISFFIPEIYHRRIIGVGGKNIQKIMKRYGVYVKFLGAEEFNAMGGYFENEHNVVARTPMKNHMSLDYLRQSVTEFITMQEDKDFSYTHLEVPFYLHRKIPHIKSSAITEACNNNNCRLWWPERLGQPQITLFGPECQLAIMKEFISHLVPITEYFALPWSLKLETLLGQQHEWQKFVKSLGGEVVHYIIENNLPFSDWVEWMPYYSQDRYIMFRVSLNHPKVNIKVKDVIISFFESKGIHVSELNPVQVPGLVSDTSSEKNVSEIDGTHDVNNESVSSILPLDECPLRAIFESIPSPPLTEYTSSSLFNPYDKKDAVSSLFSSSYPTGKNIWASDQLTNNQKPKLLSFCSPVPDTQCNIDPISSADTLLAAPFHPPGLYYSHYPYLNMEKSKSNASFGPMNQSDRINNNKQIPDMFLGGRDLFERSQLRSLSMPMLAMNHQYSPYDLSFHASIPPPPPPPGQFKPIKRHSLPSDVSQRHGYNMIINQKNNNSHFDVQGSQFENNLHYNQNRPHSFNI